MTDPDATGRPPSIDGDGPDDRDLDEGGLDLSPRTGAAPARTLGGGRRWVAVGVLGLLVVAVAFIAIQARGATVFYKNADEAVRDRADLGQKRFRLQGTVTGKVQRARGSEPTRFTVTYHGVDVDIVHTGSEPAALFKTGLPVVAEGHWNQAGTAFDSDRILVKHTEDYKKKDDGTYEEEHPDRVKDEDDAK